MDRNKLKNVLVLSSFFVFIGVFYFIGHFRSAQSGSNSAQVKRELVMGSLAKVKIYSNEASPSFLDSLFNTLYSLDTLTDFYNPRSDLYEFNQADRGTVKVDTVLSNLIDSSFKYAHLTRGNYNPAVGPLSGLWHRSRQREQTPSEDRIDSTRAISRLQFFELLNGNKIYKGRNNAKLDLGGVAKGFAVEKITQRIEEAGRDYLIDIGGTVKAFGNDKNFWKIGIRHPRKPGELFATFKLPNGYSCSTAGDYQQFFIKDSVRYHHIIDPQTGYPARNRLVSVTLVSKNAVSADALATGLFVIGLQAAKKFIEKNSGSEAIFIFQKGKNLYIQSTDNLKVTRLRS